MYSDGYKAYVFLELAVAGTGTTSPSSVALGALKYNGMCFGVNATVQGAYCLWYWGDDSVSN